MFCSSCKNEITQAAQFCPRCGANVTSSASAAGPAVVPEQNPAAERSLIDRIPLEKIVSVLAAIFGISMGLCGVNFFATIAASGHDKVGSFLLGLGMVELVVMGASMAGMVLTILIMVVRAISRSGRYKT